MQLTDLINEDTILTSAGMRLVLEYYEKKRTFGNNKVYYADSYEELTLLLEHIDTSERVGVILRNSPGVHKTPLLIENKEILMLDSLGESTCDVDNIKGAIKKVEFKEFSVKAINYARQTDSTSCGSDAFLVIKNTLREPNIFDDYFRNGRPTNLPPMSVVKYTQNPTRVYSKLNKKKGVKKGLLDVHTGYQAEALVNNRKTGRTETLMDYFTRHQIHTPSGNMWNNALTDRSKKHRDILENYCRHNAPEFLYGIAAKHSMASYLPISGNATRRQDGLNLDDIYTASGIKKTTRDGMQLYHFSASKAQLGGYLKTVDGNLRRLRKLYVMGQSDIRTLRNHEQAAVYLRSKGRS